MKLSECEIGKIIYAPKRLHKGEYGHIVGLGKNDIGEILIKVIFAGDKDLVEIHPLTVVLFTGF